MPDPIAMPNAPMRRIEGAPVFALVDSLLRRARLIALCAIGVASIVAGFTVLQPARFTSEGAFAPQGRRAGLSGVLGVAAQLGVDVSAASGDGPESPQFYADMLRSRPLVSALVDRRYVVPSLTGANGATLVTLLEARGNTAVLQREDAIRRLESAMQAMVLPKTGVVRFSVRTRHPELSRQVALQALAALDSFNIRARRSRASAERRFAQTRQEEVRRDLRAAEDRLLAFRTSNASVLAPGLQAQLSRLERELRAQEQLYLTLSQAYERAKLDEVRDTPVFTVLQAPEASVARDARGTVTKTLAGAVGGLLIGIFVTLVLGVMEAAARDGLLDGTTLARWGKRTGTRSAAP
jgi:uncharacterized protein involved in exopolysaccharide biosynthesis